MSREGPEREATFDDRLAKSGALDEDSWVENQAIVQYWLRGAGCRDWWKNTGRHLFGKKFVGFIDAELQDINAA